MPNSKLFLDTSFIQANIITSDQYHSEAKKYRWLAIAADEIWTTEAILSEVADALSNTPMNRSLGLKAIDEFVGDERSTLVSVDSGLFHQALELYRARSDKNWGSNRLYLIYSNVARRHN